MKYSLTKYTIDKIETAINLHEFGETILIRHQNNLTIHSKGREKHEMINLDKQGEDK